MRSRDDGMRRRLWVANAVALGVLMCGATFAAPANAPGKSYTVPDLTKTMSPAVVFIGNVSGNGEVVGIGSGFVVNPDGVVVTNYHVIEGAQGLQIKMKDGEIYDRVDVLDYDTRRDIAVLKIRPFTKLPALSLADSPPEPGEDAVAIGNPQGLEHTVSVGVVSAYRQGEGYRMMQISVPISPGSSGGPLFNLAGEVVGITSAGMVGEGAQNLNFAVPIEYVRPLIASTNTPVPIAEFTKKLGGAAPSPAPASHATMGSNQAEWAWQVAHDHGDSFETYCLGILYLSDGTVGFTNDERFHAWELPVSAVREVAKNAFYGADKEAFHLKSATGSNYNFVALNDELQLVGSDPIILAVLEATQ